MNAKLQPISPHELPVNLTSPASSWWQTKVINNEFRVLAVLSAIGLILGVANVGGGAFSGLCLAFGAILFGLSFIIKAIHKAEEAAASS
jgi:hypothetical protein